MLTLVRGARSRQSSAATTALVADYLLFERQRRETRPYIHAFAVFAALSLIGGAAGSVPRSESIVAAAVLLLPVVVLLGRNAWRWSRLQRRLGAVRAEIQQAAHKKVIKSA
jgi:hypothetical protein